MKTVTGHTGGGLWAQGPEEEALGGQKRRKKHSYGSTEAGLEGLRPVSTQPWPFTAAEERIPVELAAEEGQTPRPLSLADHILTSSKPHPLCFPCFLSHFAQPMQVLCNAVPPT